jgi:hypothetical protein
MALPFRPLGHSLVLSKGAKRARRPLAPFKKLRLLIGPGVPVIPWLVITRF